MRKELKMTQVEFADAIKCPRTKLSKIENGKENLTFEQLSNLKTLVPDWEDYILDEKQESEQGAIELQQAKKEIERLNKLLDNQNILIDLLKNKLK